MPLTLYLCSDRLVGLRFCRHTPGSLRCSATFGGGAPVGTFDSVTAFSGIFGRTPLEPAGVGKFHVTGTQIGHCFGDTGGATPQSVPCRLPRIVSAVIEKTDESHASTANRWLVPDTRYVWMFDARTVNGVVLGVTAGAS